MGERADIGEPVCLSGLGLITAQNGHHPILGGQFALLDPLFLQLLVVGQIGFASIFLKFGFESLMFLVEGSQLCVVG
jgi:hypothetical protein